MPVVPVSEPGHTGYLYCDGDGCLAIDPPLEIADVVAATPMSITAVVQTGIPTWRINGARLLADAEAIPLFAPDSVATPAVALHDGDPVPGFDGVVARATPTGLLLTTPKGVFVGDLDSPLSDVPPSAVTAARSEIAASHQTEISYGSDSQRPAGALAQLAPPEAGDRLNADAVDLTNRGVADLWWADPRWVGHADQSSLESVMSRGGSPWAPLIVDLDGSSGIADARRVIPERVATELAGHSRQEVVIISANHDLAQRAAGFLVRLGIRATWSSRT